jgi:hypothetical protein
MKQIYHNYLLWEDYKNGMYETVFDNESELINKSILLLSDKDEFNIKCKEVIDSWVKCTDVNLTNKSINRQSWLGQAVCCYCFGTPEIATRKAWGKLSNETKKQANLIADENIKYYERKHFKLHRGLGEPLLF